MLDKYQNFFKLSQKTQVSVYQANTHNHLNVLLKRFQTKMSWDNMLTNPHLAFFKKCKIFPKMIQIFKHKGDYFMVLERPNGQPLNSSHKISRNDFYLIFWDFCQYVKELLEITPFLWIRPQWVFRHRNGLKIVHFQPFFVNKDMMSSQHVYFYKETSEQQDSQNNSQSSHQKDRNIVTTLGILAYHLLTGNLHEQPQDENQYSEYAKKIASKAQQITSVTKDQKLTQIISKMLSNDLFVMPSLESAIAFFKQEGQKLLKVKKKSDQNEKQQQEEKQQKEEEEEQQIQKPKKIRQCCVEMGENLERIRQQNKTQHQAIKKQLTPGPHRKMKTARSPPKSIRQLQTSKNAPLKFKICS